MNSNDDLKEREVLVSDNGKIHLYTIRMNTPQPLWTESAETRLLREQKIRSIKRLLITVIAAFLGGGVLEWLLSKV